MSPEELALYLKDAWGTHVRDRSTEGSLSGVYTGELIQRGGVKSPVVLCIEFKRGGGLTGYKFSKKSDGSTKVAIDTRKSSWRPNKIGYSLRIFVYEGEGMLIEGIANPRSRVIDTVTWQPIGGREYQKATPFKWLSYSLSDAQRRLRDNQRSLPNENHQQKRRKGLSLRNDIQPQPKDTSNSDSLPVNKPVSQVFGDRSSMGSLGVFKDEAEAARASNYHKIHGKYPPEIQNRMIEKGLMKEPNKDQLTWSAIKETYDGARRKGCDGSLHESERERRIRGWLADVVLPPASSPSYRSTVTPQKPAKMPPPHPQPNDSSNHRAKHWLNSAAPQAHTSSSPTYGVMGFSPYPHSARADQGDETPYYGELATTSPVGLRVDPQQPSPHREKGISPNKEQEPPRKRKEMEQKTV
eukprot:TRINITY_DN3919_c0_g1_i1.p1 TRINITY_DN3919_c0_g1~~TRINITY_DN3919_c0_g1_i1.p1  ORF type:complete len:411 (+),score=58.64 TRINITY_DN3919_c0_g1_i1:36-1268(+)